MVINWVLGKNGNGRKGKKLKEFQEEKVQVLYKKYFGDNLPIGLMEVRHEKENTETPSTSVKGIQTAAVMLTGGMKKDDWWYGRVEKLEENLCREKKLYCK